MRTLITSAAFLCLCPACGGTHGQIRFNDGTYSEPFASKESALRVLKENPKLTEEELPELHVQIRKSNLLEKTYQSPVLEEALRSLFLSLTENCFLNCEQCARAMNDTVREMEKKILREISRTLGI